MWPFSSFSSTSAAPVESSAGSSSSPAAPPAPLPAAAVPPPATASAAAAADRPGRTFREELELQSALYPEAKDVPSCLDMFDEHMKCMMSVKEQARSFYRTGSLANCDELGANFTWCWSVLLKIKEPERRREAYVQRRAEWWTRRRLGESSEDVWDARGADRLVDFPPRLSDVDELKTDMSTPRPDNGSA